MDPTSRIDLLTIFFVRMALVVLSRFYVFFEQLYALKYRKPFFLNAIPFKKKLSPFQLRLLNEEFAFYRNLDKRDQDIFQHRLAHFIAEKQFIGRQGLQPNERMKTLIGATAVMLTFGFRKYSIGLIETIIIYPRQYHSKVNETYHKGEVNPNLKVIVFSWEDFEHGYHVGDDNLNVGIHEFGHAIHLNAFGNKDTSSVIFKQGFQDLITYLKLNASIRQSLIQSKYFRAYAYTNHYEFFAVLLESLIETPRAFKKQFPELYRLMQKTMNFYFAGY